MSKLELRYRRSDVIWLGEEMRRMEVGMEAERDEVVLRVERNGERELKAFLRSLRRPLTPF